MSGVDTEDRIAVFLDYENLAIGARDYLGGMDFAFRPIADALAERGRLVVRRAYADWSYFDEDRRMLTRSHVELIEIPQRMGHQRKNAADIKMAVDAVELAFERDYISTFVLCTGDSDFTPLVHKLRELNKRVIGVGVEKSTSALLPPACDEFLYYDRLEGVEVAEPEPVKTTKARKPRHSSEKTTEADADDAAQARPGDVDDLSVLIVQTVAGLQRSSSDQVNASSLKRTLLRKDPTFNEADYGFRAFGELLRYLEKNDVVKLGGNGDLDVSLPEHGEREAEFELLRSVLGGLSNGQVALSGLKDQLRKSRPDFSEKKLGYRSFLQFCKAAETRGVVELAWDEENGDYTVTLT